MTEHKTAGASQGSVYGRLMRIRGAKAFCASAALARLPMSMMSLGIVLALNHVYNNWTIAGSMSAAYILSVAVVTPVYARLFDRFGQRVVGKVALTMQVVAMLAFACGALVRVPLPVLFTLAVAMGLTQFSYGALVRTRWAYALRDDETGLLNTAYALEAAIDEVVFILGPILAAFLATSVHPVSQLFVPTCATAIGGTTFFSLRQTQPPVVREVAVRSADARDGDVRNALEQQGAAQGLFARRGNNGRKSRSALLYPGILPLLVVFLVFNMSFTAFDVSITASMKAMGLEQLLGIQLAMFAVGSCVGALLFGSRELSGSHWRHMVMFLCALTVGFVMFRVTMDNLVLLGCMEVLAGLAVSPIFATGNLIVKDIVPARSLTEGLSWVTTAGTVGASFGSTVAGLVLDRFDPHIGLMVPWICTACAVPLALLGWTLARKSGAMR